MRSKPVIALPFVEGDLRHAMAHYESWHPEGGAHLLNLYQETISWIGWHPDSFPKVHRRMQRAILKRSYYLVYFTQEKDHSVILAVLDGRMSPAVITRLLSSRERPAT